MSALKIICNFRRPRGRVPGNVLNLSCAGHGLLYSSGEIDMIYGESSSVAVPQHNSERSDDSYKSPATSIENTDRDTEEKVLPTENSDKQEVKVPGINSSVIQSASTNTHLSRFRIPVETQCVIHSFILHHWKYSENYSLNFVCFYC